MIWLQFLFTAVVTVIAANYLAKYGDVIALRTKLGGLFVGTLLLSGATSLPELLTAINSIEQGIPDLTVGNIFGSAMFNMVMLAILDILHRQTRILRRVATSHALSAGLAVMLTGMAVFFILAKIDFRIGWIGIDSILLIGMYFLGTYFIRSGNRQSAPEPDIPPEQLALIPSLRRAVLGFSAATLVLVMITPLLVSSSAGIAEVTGLGAGFVGLALVAVVTSLPEVVTTIAATRMGAYDLAVGNLFGSNIFNIFALGLTDVFYTQGSFLVDINNPMLVMSGLLGLILTALALVGNLARVERRIAFVELDAMLILIIYVVGLIFLYTRGLMT
jgi:cation:H+ antiporter